MYEMNFRRAYHVRVYFYSNITLLKTLYKSTPTWYNKIDGKPFDFNKKRVNIIIWKIQN